MRKITISFMAGCLCAAAVCSEVIPPAASVVIPPAIDFPTGVSRDRLTEEMLWRSVQDLPVGQRPRIVLVLGGGGARGLSHIGVLRVFEEEHIPIDRVVGVSVGALIGSLYASGLSIDQIESMAEEVGWNKLTDVSRVSAVRLILTDELFSTKRMETYLNTYIGGKTFGELKIPFACVATDLRTGDRVVFEEGSVAIAARASATLPGIFEPVDYRHRYLVDGGLVDNLPTDLVEKNAQTLVIAVLPRAEETKYSLTSAFTILVRSVEIQKDYLLKDKIKTADFLLAPDLGAISMVDLNSSKECIAVGTRAARAAALRIKTLIIKRTLALQGGKK